MQRITVCTLFKSNYFNWDEKGFEGNMLCLFCLLERIICRIFQFFQFQKFSGPRYWWRTDVDQVRQPKDMQMTGRHQNTKMEASNKLKYIFTASSWNAGLKYTFGAFNSQKDCYRVCYVCKPNTSLLQLGGQPSTLQCTMCCLYSILTSQPNELRPTVKFVFWYIF